MTSPGVPPDVHPRLKAVRGKLPWGRELGRIEEILDEPTPDAADLKSAVGSLKALVDAYKLADAVDSHTLPDHEIKRLWASPRTAAMEAVERGEYRERRILVEGKVAWTNWWLGLMAFFASMTAVGLEVWRGFN